MPSMRPPTNKRTDFESHREAGLLWISNPGISCEDQNWVADHFHKLYDTAGPPITRLWLEGRIPDYIQHRLLMFLIQVQPPIEILIMQDSPAPFWLLPTILQLVKNVQTLELRDAIIDDSEDVPSWWSLVCHAIGQCQSLQCITLGWTHTYHEARGYEATVDPPKATPATDLWTKALMALPKLEVYVQEGWEPIDGDPWSRTNLLRLLNHPSLMAVRLAVPLVGVWPVGTPKVYPARKHSLDLILSDLPTNDCQTLVQHLPVRSLRTRYNSVYFVDCSTHTVSLYLFAGRCELAQHPAAVAAEGRDDGPSQHVSR